MFVRFISRATQDHSHHKTGVFDSFYQLKYDDAFDGYELAQAQEIIDWFNKELEAPTKLSSSKNPHALEVALSWFKPTAKEHIARMHELKQILESHGVVIDIIKTDRPGKITYEDEFQIAAVPFKDSGA